METTTLVLSPKVLSLTFMQHWRSVSANAGQQCSEPAAFQSRSEPFTCGFSTQLSSNFPFSSRVGQTESALYPSITAALLRLFDNLLKISMRPSPARSLPQTPQAKVFISNCVYLLPLWPAASEDFCANQAWKTFVFSLMAFLQHCSQVQQCSSGGDGQRSCRLGPQPGPKPRFYIQLTKLNAWWWSIYKSCSMNWESKTW